MNQGNEQRVLVVAPVGRDASLICDLLARQGFGCESCGNVRELAGKIGESTGALLITDEALGENVLGHLLEVLNMQPPWSDVPLILLTDSDNARTKLIDQNWARRRNVIVVDRPVRKVALTTAVRAALQDRTHQYQIRDHLESEKRKDDQLRQSQRLESLGILAGGVAHDFNNLLTGILGNASLILNDIPTGHPARDRAQAARGVVKRVTQHAPADAVRDARGDALHDRVVTGLAPPHGRIGRGQRVQQPRDVPLPVAEIKNNLALRFILRNLE